jgi:hypothetical protein
VRKSVFSDSGVVKYNDLCMDNLEGDIRLKGELSDKQMIKDWIIRNFPEYRNIVPRTYFKTRDMDELRNWLNGFEIPNKFVLKNTHGSGMNVIVKDRSKINVDDLITKSTKFMNTCFHCTPKHGIHETQYTYNSPHIIIEEYIGDNPSDYKFHIIDGEIKFFQVDNDRFGGHSRNLYSPDGKLLNDAYITNKITSADAKLPRKFMLSLPYMKKMSMDIYNKINTLSKKPIRLLRVDYFFINDRPYLGELTFTHGACAQKFNGIPGII